MSTFDRVKPVAAGALAAALVLQIGYESTVLGKQPVTFEYILRFVAIGLAAALLATYGRSFVLNTALRLLIAADFAYSIADRFGALGPYHTTGVSWGNWKNFVYYTHALNWYLPAAFAPYFAAAATGLEAALAILLLLGILPRVATLATAVLLIGYVVTMSLTSGFASQFDFAVLLLASAAFFVTCTGAGAKAPIGRRLPRIGGI